MFAFFFKQLSSRFFLGFFFCFCNFQYVKRDFVDPTVHSCATDVEMRVSATILLGTTHKVTGSLERVQRRYRYFCVVLEESNITLNVKCYFCFRIEQYNFKCKILYFFYKSCRKCILCNVHINSMFFFFLLSNVDNYL